MRHPDYKRQRKHRDRALQYHLMRRLKRRMR